MNKKKVDGKILSKPQEKSLIFLKSRKRERTFGNFGKGFKSFVVDGEFLTGHDDLAGEVDVPLADPVPGYARVVAEIPLQDVADPELGAIVEHADPVRDLHGLVLLVPEDLRGRGSAGLKTTRRIESIP